MKSGRLLGIDHGNRRIGLAISDFSWLIARELNVVKRKSKQEDFEKLNRIASEQKVVGLIVGLPSDLDADPEAYTQADTVRLWVERYSATTDLPILLWDEQMTSQDARDLAKQKKRKPHEPIDDLAARLILQSYMDALRDGLAPAPLSE